MYRPQAAPPPPSAPPPPPGAPPPPAGQSALEPSWPPAPPPVGVGEAGPAGARRGRRRTQGVGGGIVAAGLALLKYGLVVAKFLKFATLISFFVSFLFLAQIFGWQFGLGLLVLIAVHEFGHLLFARMEGLPVSAPIFLGPFGAVVGMKRAPADRRQEAIIAIGGPVVGTAGAFACFGLAVATHPSRLSYLLLALAYFACFLNLFNLVPLSPLDGGRVAGAFSRWANVVGLVILTLIVMSSLAGGRLFNPILVLILVIGAITTIQRFQRERRGLEPPPLPARTRRWIAAAYVAMLATTALGMTAAHNALIDANYVPAPSSASGSEI